MFRLRHSLLMCSTSLFVILIMCKVHIMLVVSREKLQEDYWQPVQNSSFEIWVYSAYLEDREIENKHFEHSHAIRIISRSAFNKSFERNLGVTNEIVCRFWYDQEDTCDDAKQEDVVNGNMKYIREHYALKYSASFVYCPLKDSKKIPTSVSIYANAQVKNLRKSDPINLPPPSNRLLIHSKRKFKVPGADIAVCVAPIHSQYSKAWNIMEWIEMNRILGVNHFYIYSQSVSENVTCVLNEYAARGIVTILDWDGSPYFGLAQKSLIREYNMFAALNDCLYRGMYKHKYVASFDVDEFLVPKKHKDLIGFMKDIDHTQMASVTFRNTFFYTQWPDDPAANNSKLFTMKKTRRRVDFNRDGERSKYIFKPREVLEVGNHFLWETRTSKLQQLPLALDKGFVHHYRSLCEIRSSSDAKDYCLELKSEIDTSIWKWKNELTEAMNRAEKTIGAVCELTPM